MSCNAGIIIKSVGRNHFIAPLRPVSTAGLPEAAAQMAQCASLIAPYALLDMTQIELAANGDAPGLRLRKKKR